MKNILLKSVLFAAMLLFGHATVLAQKLPSSLKVAKTNRPTALFLNTTDLTKFYQNFGEPTTFRKMKLAKTELAYYLIASEAEGPRIFAFELEQKGKRLCLNKFFPVQSCSTGELTLDTFIETNGKIAGCRLGSHKIQQFEKN